MLLTLAAQRRLLFIGGKGGVGKTSIASAVALARAEQGARVLIVSTDPAHSLGHLWQVPIGDDLTALGPAGLHGLEVDPVRATTEHLAQVGDRLQQLVPAHLRSEVTKHLRLAQDAPGTHEAAILERLAITVEEQWHHFDLIVFDTAPSGHTAHLMTLPETMSAWTQGMLHRHDRSQRLTEALQGLDSEDPASGVAGQESARADRDSQIRHVLLQRQRRFAQLRDTLADEAMTGFIVGLMAERLPVLETIELVDQLRRTGMTVASLVVNKRSPADAGALLAQRHAQEAEYLRRVTAELPELPLLQVPLLGSDVTSVGALRQIAQHLDQPTAV